MSSPSLPLSDPWRDPLPCTRSAGRTRAQPSSTTRPTRPIAATSPGCSPPRRGGAVTPRASLVAARTAMEEAVYEVVLRQAALVEDLQGRGAAREAEAGRRRWRDEQLEQKGNVELGIQVVEFCHGIINDPSEIWKTCSGIGDELPLYLVNIMQSGMSARETLFHMGSTTATTVLPFSTMTLFCSSRVHR
uniref:Uncharacterized protein n=1 Tax=Aegilops tauschii subsp. strangulata TaxID=200361 RepID=A0A453BJT9_AEGTS